MPSVNIAKWRKFITSTNSNLGLVLVLELMKFGFLFCYTVYMYIKVIVQAFAKKESFLKKSKDHFRISVKEKAQRNMANTRVIELMAEHFQIPKNKVHIINGHHHPSKLLSVDLE